MKKNLINLAKSLESTIERRRKLFDEYKKEQSKDKAAEILELGTNIRKLETLMVSEISSERWEKYSWGANEAIRVGDVIYIHTSLGRFLRVEINQIPNLMEL